MLWRPRSVDPHPICGDKIGRRHFVPLSGAQPPVRHRGQPKIGVEADLMRSMPGQHRSASRLRDVADEQPGPARFGGKLRRQALQKRDQDRMAPRAVARRTHDLPIRSVGRQGHRAAETSPLVSADRPRRARGRRHLAAEQHLRRVGWRLSDHHRAARRLLRGRILGRSVAAASPDGEDETQETGDRLQKSRSA